MFLLASALAIQIAPPARAQSPQPPIARAQIQIVGVTLLPEPVRQTVPKNTATTVNLPLAREGEVLPTLPPSALVRAELRGPAFSTPVPLTALPNQPIEIPPLPLPGLYVLENIRLVNDGVTLLQGAPDAATIEVIDKLLVSQVTSRPLTAQEILDKGIYFDEQNFQVRNFTVQFEVGKSLDIPVLVPDDPRLPVLELPSLLQTNNPGGGGSGGSVSFTNKPYEVAPFLFEFPDDPEVRDLVPPIPGIILIPGNIAFLNQFFSVQLFVSNVAPGYSNLVVRDLQAEIVLPTGADTVRGSGDDPLRMARLGDPPQPQAQIQPVLQPGPDGQLGTADDLHFLAPTESGNSEFLVEGLKEGIHTVEMQITGTLEGLPRGPVKVTGRAVGVVEVRNPNFVLTFNHPETVLAGQPYDLLVTITNISHSPANFVSLSLLSQRIQGAVLLSDNVVSFESIPPGDSATAVYQLLSLRQGQVTATNFEGEGGVQGKFDLAAGVVDPGAALSPNTLALPAEVNALPIDLRYGGLALLNQAWALATSPVTPEGLLPLRQAIVYERAGEFAAAGQRLDMAEPLLPVARDLALSFLGNNYSRIAAKFAPNDTAGRTQAEQDYRGFDALLRGSPRGAAFLQLLANLFSDATVTTGVLPFQADFAQAVVSRPAHLSAIIGNGAGSAPALLQITNGAGQQLGQRAPSAPTQRAIPFGGFFTLDHSLSGIVPHYSQLGVVAVPEAGEHLVEVFGLGAGAVDLGLVVPEAGQLRRITFAAAPVAEGSVAHVRFVVGSVNDYRLEIDLDHDGQIDQQLTPTVSELVPDTGPSVVSAIQVVTGRADASRYGRLLGLQFSEEISLASAQSGQPQDQLTHYQVAENKVLGAILQRNGRVVLLVLRDAIGAYLPRTITVSGIEDLTGKPMAPLTVTLPISGVLSAGGPVTGQVKRSDGAPVPNALVEATVGGQVIAVKTADAEGRFVIDYVATGPFRLKALDPETGEDGEALSQLRYPGQRLNLDVVLLGSGSLIGRALALDGTPLAGAAVQVQSITKPAKQFVVTTGADGVFAIAGIPVGNFSLRAVHTASLAQTLVAGNIPTPGAQVIQDVTLIPLEQVQIETGVLKGQVFRADGQTPAAGIPVYTNRGGLATTDASGSYRIEGLPAGSVTLRAIDEPLLEQATVATTVIGGQEVTANLLLFGGLGLVRGVVIDADGRPVAGATVSGGLQITQTDSAGLFVLREVPLGNSTIQARDEARQLSATVTVNLTRPGEEVTIQIRLPARATLAGRVFAADGVTPIPQLKIFAFGPTQATTVTDDAGAYRLENLPLGAYTLSAFRPDFSDGNVAQAKLTFQGEVRRTDLTFRGRGQVTGIVLDSDGVTPIGGRVGLSELLVKKATLVHPENPNCVATIQVGDVTITPPQCETVGLGFQTVSRARVVDNDATTGAFAFEDIFVGDLTVEAASPLHSGVIAVRSKLTQAGITLPVTLTFPAPVIPGPAPIITGVVTGTVYLPNGIAPVGKDVVITLNSGSQRDLRTVTDGEGHYQFDAINAGSFTVRADDLINGLVGQTSGSVAAESSANVPIRLLGRGVVTVTVVGSNGPLAGAQVNLQRGSFPNERRTGATDANGIILFAGGDMVTEGSFSVSATDPATGLSGFTNGVVPTPGGAVAVQITIADDAGNVSGHFYKSDGVTAIPNAQVVLSTGGKQAFTTTDAEGGFRFEGILRGTFTLDAFDPASGRRGRSSGQIATNREEVTVDIRQLAQGTVRGTVRLSTDQAPIAGASLSIVVSNLFGERLTTTSGADGSFQFPAVSAGSFTISAVSPTGGNRGSVTGVLQTEGEIVVRDLTIQVPVIEQGRVEGYVSQADGTPALGAQVTLQPGGRSTTVDNDGFYFFNDVALGSVSLLATAAVGPDGGVAGGQVAFDGDVAQVDIRFVGTGRVQGTVFSAVGDPVPAARVVLTRRTSTPRPFTAETVSDANGQFVFAVVPVGEVSVTAVQAGTELAGSASGVIDGDSSTLDLPVVLQPAANLQGRVFHADGVTPAAKVAIELVSTARRFGTTADDGSFQFTDLKLGTYQLIVSDPLGEGLARVSATLSEQGQTLDLGTLLLDETAPFVAAITPADGASNQPVDQVIHVLFSEPVNPATVNGSHLLVSSSQGAIAGLWALDAAGVLATFTPTTRYRDFTQINIKVKSTVTDLVGKPLRQEFIASFTTTDITPPQIVSVSPAAGAQNVALESVIRLTFNEAIDPAQLNGPAITLLLDGVPVTGTVDFTLNNTVVIFTPAAPLAPNATATIQVAAATDLFGNRQSAAANYSFTTLDLQPPVIRSLTAPGGNAVRVGTTATILAELESAADVAYVEFLVNGQSRLIDQSAPYQYGLPVTAALLPQAIVSARAVDLVGNVSTEKTLTLTVLADTVPQVTILSPATGAVVNSGSRFAVSVHAGDDWGVSQILIQATGALQANNNIRLQPPTTAYTATAEFTVPATAAPGTAIVVQTNAIDTGGQASAIISTTIVVGDGTPPAVQFTAPANGATVDPGTTLAVVLSATDNGAVAAVNLQASGAATLSDTQTISPTQSPAVVTFQVPVSATAQVNDTVLLRAQAQDSAGNWSQPVLLTVGIREGDSPLVNLNVAHAITKVIQGTAVTVTVAATDNVGLRQLGVRVNGAFVATTTRAVVPNRAAAESTFVIPVPVTATVGSTFTMVGTATDSFDNLGISAPVSITVAPDLPPTIVIREPITGAVVTTNRLVTITLQATDDVGLAELQLQSTGALTTSQTQAVTPPQSSKTMSFVLPIPADAPFGSTIMFTAVAVDKRGQRTFTSPVALVVGADATPPTVTMISPLADVPVEPAQPLTITVHAIDNQAVARLDLQVSGALNLTQTQLISPTSAVVTATFRITLPATATANETVVLTVRAIDQAGNQSAPTTRILDISDRFAPAVTLSATDAVTTVIQGAAVSLIVTATDEVGIADIGLQVDGAFATTITRTVTPSQQAVAQRFTITAPITAPIGSTVYVHGLAHDTAGNVAVSASISLTVVADQPPVVTITAPVSGQRVNTGSQVNLTVRAQDDVGVHAITLATTGSVTGTQTVTLTQSASVYTTTFIVNIPFDAPLGSVIQLYAEAVDVRGLRSNRSIISLTVGEDGTAPVVTFVEPLADATVDPGTTLAVVLSAIDNVAVTSLHLQVTGAATLSETQIISPVQASITSTFSITIPPTATATSPLQIAAVVNDSNGNQSAPVTINLAIRDIFSPTVTLAVKDDMREVIQGSNVLLTISATDEVGVATVGYEINDGFEKVVSVPTTPIKPNASTDFELTIPITAALDTQFAIVGIATDEAGNLRRSEALTLTVIADRPPLAVITAPTDGSTVNAGIQELVEVVVTDDIGITRVVLTTRGVITASQIVTLPSASPIYTATFTVDIPGNIPDGSSVQFIASTEDTRGQSNTSQAVSVSVQNPTMPSCGTIPATTASYFTDPEATIEDRNTEIVLQKVLSGYGNYGQMGGADILYTGQSATWTFTLPSSVDLNTIQDAFFRVAMVADDHSLDLTNYTLNVWANNTCAYSGPANVPHGSPTSGTFTNWVEQEYRTSLATNKFTITLVNTSSATSGDWLAVDWIELHLQKPPSCVTSPNGIISWWTANGTAQNLINDGSSAVGTTTYAPAVVDRGFHLQNTMLRASGAYDFSSTNEATFEGWFKLDEHTGYSAIISSEGCCNYRLLVSPNNRMFYNPGTHTDIEAGPTIPIGQFTHVALTISGGNMAHLFVNGELVHSSASGVPAILPSVSNLLLGAGENANAYLIEDGVLDEIAVYNRALSATEIRAIFDAGSAGKCLPANRAPETTEDRYSVDEDQVLQVNSPGVLTNDRDPDGDTLTVFLVNEPTHGTVAFNQDGSFVYTPTVGFHGIDTFSYQASDGELNSAVTPVTITVGRTEVCGALTENQIWGPWGSPYVVTCAVTINSGVSLQIAAGTVIKFQVGGYYLNVNGTLISTGTSTEPVIFTSLRDDTVGGDTNRDGSASQPTPGSWGRIQVNSGANANLTHTILRFAGADQIDAIRTVGLYNNGGTLSLDNSFLVHNHAIGLYNTGTTILTATQVLSTSNGIGLASGAGLLQVTDSLVRGNREQGISVGNGILTVSGSTISDNTLDGIYLSGNSQPTIRNSIISNNQRYGINTLNQGALTVADSIIVDNNNYPIYLNSTVQFTPVLTLTNNTVSNNGLNGIGLRATLGTMTLPRFPDLPYIVEHMAIPAGQTLTLLPGTLFKFHVGGYYVNANGTLISTGTSTEPVIFTSLRDDTVGGDTNRDGSASQPTPGSWGRIQVNSGANANLTHTILRFAGADQIDAIRTVGLYNNGGTLSLDNSSLTSNNVYGLYHSSGSTSVRNTNITNNTNYGIYNADSTTVLDAENNWWGDPSGPTPLGTGDRINQYVDADPWLTSAVQTNVSADLALTDTLELSLGQFYAVGPDSKVLYAHTLSYSGNVTKTVRITVTSQPNWIVTVTPVTATLSAGDTISVTVALTVPADTSSQTTIVTVTATISETPGVQAVVQDIISVEAVNGTGVTQSLDAPAVPPAESDMSEGITSTVSISVSTSSVVEFNAEEIPIQRDLDNEGDSYGEDSVVLSQRIYLPVISVKGFGATEQIEAILPTNDVKEGVDSEDVGLSWHIYLPLLQR